MTKRIEVKTKLTAEALHERYRQASDAVARTHWQMLWLLKEGKSAKEVAALLGYSARVPRPQHAKADREQQEAFKKTFQPSWR